MLLEFRQTLFEQGVVEAEHGLTSLDTIPGFDQNILRGPGHLGIDIQFLVSQHRTLEVDIVSEKGLGEKPDPDIFGFFLLASGIEFQFECSRFFFEACDLIFEFSESCLFIRGGRRGGFG